jgi:hypothetical protein
MLLMALSLAFAAMFMFAGSASAQTTCPPGTTPSTVFNAAGNPVDRHFVCVPVGTTVVTPTTAFPTEVVPAVEQEFDIRRVTSGPCNPNTSINNTGNNVNLSAPVQQVCNTGNVVNEQGVVTNGTGFNTPFVDGVCFDEFGNFICDNGFRDNGIFVDDGFRDNGIFVDDGFRNGVFFDGFNTAGDIDITGSTLDISPSLTSDATQTINQAAAAGPPVIVG